MPMQQKLTRLGDPATLGHYIVTTSCQCAAVLKFCHSPGLCSFSSSLVFLVYLPFLLPTSHPSPLMISRFVT